MKTYKFLAESLFTLLGDTKAINISSIGFMPLSIEEYGYDANGRRLIVMSQNAIQNGDLMRDPETVFVIHECTGFPTAEPVTFRNDFTQSFQEVYRYDAQGKRTHVNNALKQDLKIYARKWFTILRDQGFFDPEAKRERLS